ncbi:hypothetical protein KOM00_05940 [Geomonas sp. Red69]|nr:hypothetical protein [Geomonas diazotrophica]
MKLITAAIFACAITLSFSCPLWSAEPSFESTVKKFIQVVASKDRKALANSVSYPLQRRVPLPNIDSPKQFLDAYDEILDENILKAISTSRASADWSEMGGRGFMFQNGSLWLDEDGRITAINYQTEKGKRKRADLIEADKKQLHGSLRDFKRPVLEWETAKYRIRIDQITDDKFRYAVWPVRKKTSEMPDLVLRNGTLIFDGSGGNHHYDFKSGDVLYRCFVWVIGDADTPPGEIEVYKGKKLVLNQPVAKVIKGR